MSDLLQDDTLETNVQLVSSTPPQENLTNTDNTKNILEVENSSNVSSATTVFVNDDGSLRQTDIATLIQTRIDSSMSKTGYVADAKVVGDKYKEVANKIDEQKEYEQIEINGSETVSPTAYGGVLVENIEGYIQQTTTKGDQLFDIVSTVTANQATKKILNNGRDLQVSGKKVDSSKWGYVYYTFPASAVGGKTLYTYVEFDSGLGCEFNIKDSDNNWKYPLVTSGVWTSIQVPDNVAQCSILFYPNRTTEVEKTGVYKNIKVVLTKFEEWESFTGGEPSPSPDYHQTIRGVGDMGFFDGILLQGYWDVDTSDFKPYANYVCNRNKIECNQNDEIEIFIEDDDVTDFLIIFFDENDKKISYSTNRTATAPQGVKTMGFRYRKTDITPQTAGHITVKINGMYAICVKTVGKNLVPYPYRYKTTETSSGVKFTCDSFGRYWLSGQANDTDSVAGFQQIYTSPTNFKPVMELEAEKIYYLKDAQLFILNNGVSSTVNGMDAEKIYTAKSGDVVAGIRALVERNKTYTSDRIYEPIFCEYEEGMSKEWIPYQSNTTYIPISYPLFEGDYLFNRNMEYKVYRNSNMRIYDGTESGWFLQSTNENGINNFGLPVSSDTMENDGKSQYSNMLTKNGGSISTITDECFTVNSSGYVYIRLKKSRIETLEAFKTFLKSHPIMISVNRSVPIEEDLTSEAQKALYSILSCDEQTTIGIVGSQSSGNFILPRTLDAAISSTALCQSKINAINISSILNLESRVNKLEIDTSL